MVNYVLHSNHQPADWVDLNGCWVIDIRRHEIQASQPGPYVAAPTDADKYRTLEICFTKFAALYPRGWL